MSRNPNKQTVAKLRDTIALFRRTVVDLQKAKGIAADVPKLEERAGSLQSEIMSLLESMDCKASGNFGFEGRMAWMLTELLMPPHPVSEAPS